MVAVTRAAVAAALLGPAMLVALGAADVVAFDARAASLERQWRADESAGVAAPELAPARASLRAQRERRVALLPYAAFSAALVVDPFVAQERMADRAQAQALTRARDRARDDLARLTDLGGPNYGGHQAHAAQLRAARRLPDFVRLARAWEVEAAHLADVRDRLSRAAGGMVDGQPRDVMDGVSHLQSLVAAATQAQLSADPASPALTQAQGYLKLPYASQLDQHDAVANLVKVAGDTVQHRIDTQRLSTGLLAQLDDLMSQAARYSVTSDFPARAGQARADLQAARTSGDDSRMDSATAALKRVVDDLGSAVAAARQRAMAAALQSGTACVEGAAPQLIVVHLATQQLVAYDRGCPFLRTPVTTGRPAVRTDRGTFHIFAKFPTYHMVSPWPQGDPLYYPPTWVNDAMEFVGDGTFIHGADWEPASAYGPGSENGPFASHGCVHVQDGPLAQLFAWAQIGATVIVTD